MQQLPFDKRSGKIWFNNELCEWQDARVHIISHGMHYASLVFEGLRVYNTKIFKLEEHTDRLFNSAKILDMKIPYSYNEIIEATKKLVSDQDIQNGYIRPFVWRGSEMMGVSAQNTKINVAIAIWEWPTYFDPELKLKGIKLNISKWQRPPQNSSPWESKAAGLYMICTLSKHQADTFLDGITRKTVIDLAKSKNIKINERKISPKELSNFKGCFITGTAAEITPVGNILDNNFEVCDLIKDLSTSYETLVGKNN
jgi:branched-chain amino acid aminotransferase